MYRNNPHDKEIYYKIEISDLTETLLEKSQAHSAITLRKSQNNYLGNGTQYVILNFKLCDVPAIILQNYGGLGMTQEEALAEVDGALWQV
jgi:hypothetical protein